MHRVCIVTSCLDLDLGHLDRYSMERKTGKGSTSMQDKRRGGRNLFSRGRRDIYEWVSNVFFSDQKMPCRVSRRRKRGRRGKCQETGTIPVAECKAEEIGKVERRFKCTRSRIAGTRLSRSSLANQHLHKMVQ